MSENSHEKASQARRKQRQRQRKRARIIKISVLSIIGLGIIAALVGALWPKPIGVEFAQATMGPMSVTVDEDGKTKAKSRFVLSAPIAGNMNRITLQPGDTVEEGKPILRIFPAVPPLLDKRARASAETRLIAASASMRLAGAEVERAKTALELAEHDAKHLAELAKSGVMATDQADHAVFVKRARTQELRAAVFSAKVARQNAESARVALGLFDGSTKPELGLDISAPVSGKVLRVMRADEQGLVQPGTPLIEVGDLDSLEIVADILTEDAVHIRPEASVRILRWGGSEALIGHVRLVEPSAFTRISALGVEEQRVFVIIDINSPREDWQALGDGFRVEVEVAVWQEDSVLRIPASAVFRHEGGWATYVSVDGTARLTAIEIGHRNDTMVEVLGGIEDGTTVISHPSDRVVDGVSVEARQ